MSHSSTATKGHHYFVPAASHYSTTLSIGIFLMALAKPSSVVRSIE